MALAVIATIRGCTTSECWSRIARVARSPSSLGIWTSMSTRSYAWRSTAATASAPSEATSHRYPSFSSIRVATFWLTGLSSASRIRSGWASAMSGACSSVDGEPAPGAAAPAKTPASASNSPDALIGLWRYAAKPTSAAAGSRRPSDVSITSGML